MKGRQKGGNGRGKKGRKKGSIKKERKGKIWLGKQIIKGQEKVEESEKRRKILTNEEIGKR